MPSEYVRKIIELAGPFRPVEQPTQQDWELAESELGLVLPSDHKELMASLGSGEFGAGLFLQNPVSSSDYTRLSSSALNRYRQTVGFLKYHMGITFYPEPEGLVLVGGIDRQHFLFGPSTKGGKGVSCLVNLDHDCEGLHKISMSLPRFIYDLYFGLIPDCWAERLRLSVWFDNTIPFFRAGKEAP